MKLSTFALAIASLLLVASEVQAHSGRTNSEGCHNDTRTGDYHCHNQNIVCTTSSAFILTKPSMSQGRTITMLPSGKCASAIGLTKNPNGTEYVHIVTADGVKGWVKFEYVRFAQ